MRVSLEFEGRVDGEGYRRKGGVPQELQKPSSESALMIPVDNAPDLVLRVSNPAITDKNDLHRVFYENLTIVKHGQEDTRLLCSALPQSPGGDNGEFRIEGDSHFIGILYPSNPDFLEKLRQYTDTVTESEEHANIEHAMNELLQHYGVDKLGVDHFYKTGIRCDAWYSA